MRRDWQHIIEPDFEQAAATIPPVLTPILDPAVADIVYGAPGTLLEWVNAYGSPLNIVWPHILKQNVDALRTVLHEQQMHFAIFYGAKVNKSQALVRAAVESGIGVDVSSVYELRDALRAYAKPSQICASGPAKTREFHVELVTNGCLISIDSAEELTALEECVRTISPAKKVRVLLRYRPVSAKTSRFGMAAADLLECLHRLKRQRSHFAFEGFHFHLSGYAHETRAQAIRELSYYVDIACRLDLAPRMIDIGGGLPIRYVDSQRYDAFLHHQGGEHYRNGKVPASFYPYGGRIGAVDWLAQLLAAPCVDGLSIADYFKARNMTLAIEPGRSLADQSAVTAFRITCVKPLAAGNHAIFVEGSSFSACETWFSSEFLVDPILVSTGTANNIPGPPIRAYIAGHSCLDDDVITNRLIDFAKTPQAGDLLVFANTAGYQMDLLENEFHRHPMPRRIAVSRNALGSLDVSPDEHNGGLR